jgi:hypothetical protein
MISRSHHRRGISLLEVLISMGILTIGLVSVLALIPAGRSQALKAGAIDRSVALTQNAAADFITRGFARADGWTSIPSGPYAVFDPLGQTAFWTNTIGVQLLLPRTDAAVGSTAATAITAGGQPVNDILVRGEDDVRFSTDKVGDDDPPIAVWSASPSSGRRIFDGSFSYLAMLSGTSSTWNAGEYKLLTVIAFNRRDPSSQAVELWPGLNPDGTWLVFDRTKVPADMTLRDLIKPGSAVLYKASSGTLEWKRVVLAADATLPSDPATWKIGLTCDASDPVATNTNNRLYVFPGANGSLQMPVRLEGTSPWND